MKTRDWLDVSSIATVRLPKPYRYNGYLLPWLPQLMLARVSGLPRMDAARQVYEANPALRKLMEGGNQIRQYRTYTNPITLIGTLLRSIELHAGWEVADKDPRTWMYSTTDYGRARWEHAWLLRAEGLTFRQIGNRMGVSVERARQMVWRFGFCVSHSLRKSKVTIT